MPHQVQRLHAITLPLLEGVVVVDLGILTVMMTITIIMIATIRRTTARMLHQMGTITLTIAHDIPILELTMFTMG